MFEKLFIIMLKRFRKRIMKCTRQSFTRKKSRQLDCLDYLIESMEGNNE
jgi:hypothetical protein